jgi:hypothetical protein
MPKRGKRVGAHNNNYMEKETNSPVIVRLAKEAGTATPEKLRVYVVDSEGNTIEEASFKGYEARLKTDKATLHGRSKIYIGSELPKELGKVTVTEKLLKKSGAFEAVLHVSEANVIDIFRLPSDIDNYFRWRSCRVTGHLNKNFIIDGTLRNLPVCHARVHICEVDPIHIKWPVLPDIIFVDIRNRFRKIFQQKVELTPKPRIPDPIGPVAGVKQNLPLRMLKASSRAIDDVKVKALPTLSEQVQNGLLSDDILTVKETIRLNYRILYPYFCYWPLYYHWFYSCEEIATVYTDCNGKFESWYFIYNTTDQPDIYIWVEVCINGNWVTVYRPNIPCNTWWDYTCGSDINITLSHPGIKPCVCAPLPGSIVWVKRVGNGTSIRNIALHPSAASTPSPFADVRGLTNSTGVEGNNYVSPFTYDFAYYIQFGDGFPSATVTHFRWKYRRIANAGLGAVTDSFHAQEGALTKSYTYQGTNASGDTVFYTGTLPLDVTLPGGKIYKIPHVEASVDTGIPTAEWDQDTASLHVDASGMTNGLYEYVLELCDAAGNTQVVADPVFQVDSLLPSPPNSASIPARDVDSQYLIRNTAGNVIGFRFLIRIDNDKTTCAIGDATVLNMGGTGSTTDTECGFAQYQDRATGNMLLRFDADQPHRYASYSFYVEKGNNSPISAAGSSGQVPEPATTVTVNGSLTSYQVLVPLNTLLGSCTRASFAEHLSVTAWHTNGSQRIYQYDDSDIASFAIEPVEP